MATIKQTLREQLEALTPENLRDIARNPNALPEARKISYDILAKAEHVFAKSGELLSYAAEIALHKADEVKEEVVAAVESAPIGHEASKTAGVTTANLQQVEVVPKSKTPEAPKSE